MSYTADEAREHYAAIWGAPLEQAAWDRGPTAELGSDFRVLVLARPRGAAGFTYVTLGMSVDLGGPAEPLELYLVSPVRNPDLVELLTATAHFHRTGARLGLHHTVDFGRPWLPGSRCEYGLVSLPYLDGPALERPTSGRFRVLWLVPITCAEREHKKRLGVARLEELFDAHPYFYVDVERGDLCG